MPKAAKPILKIEAYIVRSEHAVKFFHGASGTYRVFLRSRLTYKGKAISKGILEDTFIPVVDLSGRRTGKFGCIFPVDKIHCHNAHSAIYTDADEAYAYIHKVVERIRFALERSKIVIFLNADIAGKDKIASKDEVICGNPDPNSQWICTKSIDHDGRHVAHAGVGKKVLSVW